MPKIIIWYKSSTLILPTPSSQEHGKKRYDLFVYLIIYLPPTVRQASDQILLCDPPVGGNNHHRLLLYLVPLWTMCQRLQTSGKHI